MRGRVAMLGICVVAWAGPAQAADAAPDSLPSVVAPSPGADQIQFAAREHDLGYRAYLDKQYAEAASHFENAFFAAPNPAELRSAVRARRDAGELARAATLAAIGQRRFPGDPATIKVAADTIAMARSHVYEVQISSSDEYSLALDEKIVAADRVKETRLFVAPGAHELLVSWSDGRNTRIPIDARDGGSQVLQLEPPQAVAPVPSLTPAPAPVMPVPPAAFVPPPAAPPSSKPFGPAVFVAGAVLTAIGAGFIVWSGVDTLSSPGASHVKAVCDSNMMNECQSLWNTGRNEQDRTNVLIGVTSGVAVVTAAVGLFLTQWPTNAPASGARVAPAPRGPRVTPVFGIGQAGVSGAF
jgi:hypothetical protein